MPNSLKRKLNSITRHPSPPASHKRISRRQDSVASPIEPRKEALTFYSWNINGIYPLLQKQISFNTSSNSSRTYPLRTFLHDHDWPHVLCLQEVKIKPSDTKTQRLVEAAANFGNLPTEPTYTTHFSLPRDKYNAIGFGGRIHGVATLIRDDISTCLSVNPNANEATSNSIKDKDKDKDRTSATNPNINSQPSTDNDINSDNDIPIFTTRPHWDLEGRVLIHKLPTLNLTLINGYWPNGTINPYRDPTTGIQTGTRHDHKLHFHAHMLELLNTIESESQSPCKPQSIILLGDMNVAPTKLDGHPNLRVTPIQHVKNRADFNEKFLNQDAPGFRGVDIFRWVHGDSVRKYTYHGRERPWGESCDRVDLIIASERLVDGGGVVGTDICDSPRERGHSDHVPLWVEVDVGRLMRLNGSTGRDGEVDGNNQDDGSKELVHDSMNILGSESTK